MIYKCCVNFEEKMKNFSQPVEYVLALSAIRSQTGDHFEKYIFVSPGSILLFAIIVGFYVVYNWRRAHMIKLMSKIPGPPALPIIGNTVEVNVDHDGNI